MVTDKDKRLAAFSRRLNSVLDELGYPPKSQGRQNAVAKDFNVSQKGARKWLEAETFPRSLRMMEIARKYNVSFEWLSTGSGERVPNNNAPAPALPNAYERKIPLFSTGDAILFRANELSNKAIADARKKSPFKSENGGNQRLYAIDYRGPEIPGTPMLECVWLIDADKSAGSPYSVWWLGNGHPRIGLFQRLDDTTAMIKWGSDLLGTQRYNPETDRALGYLAGYAPYPEEYRDPDELPLL